MIPFGGVDAARSAEEAGERPERPEAHEEGRFPGERRVQQRHSLNWQDGPAGFGPRMQLISKISTAWPSPFVLQGPVRSVRVSSPKFW